MYRGRGIFLFLCLTGTLEVFSWGKKAHLLIVEIAKSQMSPETVGLVEHYMKGFSWEQAAMGLETAPGGKSGVAAYWHQALAPRDAVYVKGSNQDMVTAYEFQLRVLDSRALFPAGSISEAIRQICHLTGDFHFPLSCGYTDDKGGSLQPISFDGKKTDLRQLWENELLDRLEIDMWSCTRLLMSLDKKERSAIQKADHLQWYSETRATLKDVYSFRNEVADPEYISRCKGLVERQLVRAGLRLAQVLNKYFKD